LEDHFGVAALAMALAGEEGLSLAQVFVAGRIADVVAVWAAGGGKSLCN